ncbi:bifunctional folylpolyglutamate synthase/dihydrofolate synthase [Secundilactobacillus paracollinoides]|uniref:bifunctional folylpolyglutamate synthase/dihydrofolate synthase n=1 Tax=Secundilactobacillus paracollinoides TaxID=240427 RepID=UPI0006D066C1|nr:folylpolyglutamate synthase/dihydrofolate synthase family protein [Secundilactobacillus paracollinoides]KRL75971.1 folylpolyglutamate synthase [Secundilactobacillus paracollinoides DSM 15502 = JCM 11969]
MISNYEDALAFIHGRTQFKKSDHLDRMRLFMAKLGNPERQLSVIHVAGTNGKGSTVAFLRDLLMATGKTVGTFTSPFLMRFNERISVDGMPVPDQDLVALVNQIKPTVDELDATLEEGGPTEFEIITAMMFTYFKDRVDVAVVEVGIGGILDSTNVLTPEVSVITTIGYDHMKLLGNTLPEIAGQKAGIIKRGKPVVVGQLPEEALSVIEQKAIAEKSPIYRMDHEIMVQPLPDNAWEEKFKFRFDGFTFDAVKIQLLGQYQIANASCALAAFMLYQAAHHQPWDRHDTLTALAKTVWAGRFEPVNQDPLIVLDGAHNEPAVTEVTQLLKQKFSDRECYIVLAVLADKQYEKMLSLFQTVPHHHIILTTFQGPGTRHAVDPETLKTKHENDAHIDVVDNWQLAIGTALKTMSSDDLLLITGSLYFISDVRHFFLDNDDEA